MFDFSPGAYDNLLRATQTHGYRTLTCDALATAPRPAGKLLLLRHDVDVSMDYALAMAELEARLGVHATYFVMLRSPLYNLWGRHAVKTLRAIVGLGHAIGLHFDAVVPGAEKTVSEWIAFEAATLAVLAQAPVRAFSLHQPTPEIIAQNIVVPGMLNTYHPEQLAGFHYISDSNRVWRGLDPFATLAAGHEALHYLLHPIWWMRGGGSVADCWDDALALQFTRTQEQLLATERAYGAARQMRIVRQEQT
jgi:hypothetical protein